MPAKLRCPPGQWGQVAGELRPPPHSTDKPLCPQSPSHWSDPPSVALVLGLWPVALVLDPHPACTSFSFLPFREGSCGWGTGVGALGAPPCLWGLLCCSKNLPPVQRPWEGLRACHSAGGWAPRAGSGPLDGWGAGRQLAKVPSVPTGHPVKLGEWGSPALSPLLPRCFPASLPAPTLPQGHCLGGAL